MAGYKASACNLTTMRIAAECQQSMNTVLRGTGLCLSSSNMILLNLTFQISTDMLKGTYDECMFCVCVTRATSQTDSRMFMP